MTFHRQLSKSVPPPIVMMGIPFDQIDSNDLVEITDDMIARRKPHLLATANIDFLTQAQKDEELQNILINADLVLCDGTPLVWISKWLGNPLPERLAGSDMVPLLLHFLLK